MGSCQSSSLSFHVEGPQSAEQCAKALVVAAFSGHVDDPASATHLAELESRWAAVNRNQAVVQALEGIENGERPPPEVMFGGSLADPFEAANFSSPLGHGAARTSKMGQKSSAFESGGVSWKPLHPADPMRPFLVLSALAALHGLDPASQHAPALPTLVVLLGRFLSNGATFGILDSLLSKRRRAHALGPLHPNGFGKCGDSHRAHAVARAQLTSLLQARLPATTAALATLGSSGSGSGFNDSGSGGGRTRLGDGLSYFAAAMVPGLVVPLLPSRAAAMTVVTLFLQDGWRALFLCSIGLCRLLKRRIKAAATAASWLKARRVTVANDAAAADAWASAKAEDAAQAGNDDEDVDDDDDDDDEEGMDQSEGVEMALSQGGSKQGKAIPPRTASFIARAAAAATTEAVPMDSQDRGVDSAQAAAALVTTMRRLALEEEAEPWQGGPSGPAAFASALLRASCRPLPNPRVPPGRPRSLPPANALEVLLAQQLANANAPLIEAPIAHVLVLSDPTPSNAAQRSSLITSGEAASNNKSNSHGAVGRSTGRSEGLASASVLEVVVAGNASLDLDGNYEATRGTAILPEVEGGKSIAAGAVTACAPIAFDATTSALRASKLKAEQNADEDEEDATKPDVVYPELLLAGAGDRSELAGWLPEKLRQRKLHLSFATCTDGYHLPALVTAAELHRAAPSFLLVKTRTGSVFGAALLDCSFADGAANLALNGLSTFLFVLAASSAGRRLCYSNADQTPGQVAIRKEFMAIGPASDGDGYALMLDGSLHHGSSVASQTFENPPLHLSENAKESKERDFDVASVELYHLL